LIQDATKPLVSAITPLFNGERYIAQTIEPALSQTYPYIEVIVMNDGSTDRGQGIVKEYPVTLLHKDNGGIPSARNAGIKASKGEFIALLDQDDETISICDDHDLFIRIQFISASMNR
jgi:glycosyltransferase involved in cell wall biosynthesis